MLPEAPRRLNGPRLHYTIQSVHHHDARIRVTVQQIAEGFRTRMLDVPYDKYVPFVELVERQTRSRFTKKRASDYRWFTDSLEFFIRQHEVEISQTSA